MHIIFLFLLMITNAYCHDDPIYTDILSVCDTNKVILKEYKENTNQHALLDQEVMLALGGHDYIHYTCGDMEDFLNELNGTMRSHGLRLNYFHFQLPEKTLLISYYHDILEGLI